MKQHFASIQDARNAVEPYLRSWEIASGLTIGREELQFKYDSAHVMDRNPPTGNMNSATLNVTLDGVSLVAIGVVHPLKRTNYPNPPTRFQTNPNVETMWHRYQEYVAGREPLQAMAYFCLTVMEHYAGGGKAGFCSKYQVDRTVRDTLGDLTSDRGTPTEARKMTGGAPITDKERAWIDAAVKAFIRRMGEYDPNNPFPKILGMSELPSLK
jgi:hypothetical protein